MLNYIILGLIVIPLFPLMFLLAIDTFFSSNGDILRFMAGGIYLDICMSMNIGFGSFFGRRGILWRTMEAINNFYEI